MANLGVDTSDEDLIICQICFEEFDEENKKPKFLQCSHTICLECFQATRRRVTIVCPFCRTRTSKDNRKGAEWILPTNQYVLELINRTRSNSMPSTAVPVIESVEEEDEELMPALAVSAREVEEFDSLTEAMQLSYLKQWAEQVVTTATAISQPEDEQLELALNMSGREMEQEALNGAMRQSLSNQQQRVRRSRDRRSVDRHGQSRRNAVAETPGIQPTLVPNSTSDDLSNEDMFSLLLFCLSVLCYAFLLFCQLLTFFSCRLDFALAIVYFLLINSVINSSRFNLYLIFFCLSQPYGIFYLFLDMFMFFFHHLELLLIIAFFFFLVGIHVGWVSDQIRHHRTVPLSNTF